MVIGAGISGLRTAQLLVESGHSVTLLESRSRPGGRVTSARPEVPGKPSTPYGFDLGPSWFWPWQNRMLDLMRELGLDDAIFEQHSNGLGMGEYANGALTKQAGMVSMAGSLRLAGGLRVLADALVDRITPERIHFDAHVVGLKNNGGDNDDGNDGVNAHSVEITYRSAGIEHLLVADRVVIALPPRVVASTLSFSPALPANVLTQMRNTPTWMAGQAKFIAVFDQPFWRNDGLSGDAMSQIGPLGEIHDASSRTGAPYALFGFVGIPAAERQGRDADIIAGAVQQLTRMFGPAAAKPVSVHYTDWATEAQTATEQDANGPRAHSHQPPATQPMWNQTLFWAGSETASVSEGHNGYLEGALAAAERVIKELYASTQTNA